ncbi:S-adenosyl-L-methionine-dependent tRNA 4-demethylwyosine synthase [Eurytemora carolleeae]|uniref:S-adenosyl-L-methionine-dependent tRNA 4-demethylwyosine synthase n=1 Tax=Eurytemora carolleeae TaxID=1294199 RepID=UPI000C76FF55|nr:S-adenosyl-L-methionine-dependent tRNA 4-demethylwyosine synthase [Eurytemora carolleeae]|eukprot:XP_023343071.1 S-adenosyl-L-methionine-dependent tRNA 4-demethylwyosine synthase-like [Eurytemora affinis]
MLEFLGTIWSYVDPNNTGSNLLHFFKGSFASTFLVGLFVFILVQKYLESRQDNKTPEDNYFAEKEIREKVQNAPKNDTDGCQSGGGSCCQGTGDGKCSKSTKAVGLPDKVVVLYGTTTGNSRKFAEQLTEKLNGKGVTTTPVIHQDCAQYSTMIEEDFKKLAAEGALVIILISTYTDGTPPESSSWFYTWFKDYAHDFRVNRSVFKDLKFCIFGLGNSLYAENFNSVAKDLDSFMHLLSAQRFLPLCLGDENVLESKNGSIEKDFQSWSEEVENKISRSMIEPSTDLSPEVSDEDSISASEGEEEDEDEDADDGLVDLEDLGKVMKKRKNPESVGQPKEMVTDQLRKSLTKQGYKIIGSHSGVKLCRWTKAMLRGRGGCYKHTFYGIESHRCMETTPSLACANKCVFCWRHHSNPVGTEWRWKMDDAEMILNGALENHYKMINEFKGVPGVLPEKLAEGMQAKHCALSLVGEPIMYPEINKFVTLLHSKGISSFLVTNAQFPDAIRDMSPCTQLYVSIDASTKDSLKKIDRPLFKDFWERFMMSLKELDKKGQRTVYRLTLVKGWNAEEMDNYAALVKLGNPDFIEIKGVTFCGDSKASSLTMENVPWHEEVVKFVQELVDRLPDYEISCEHEHSNCVLVSHKRFKVDGKWNTWINYDRFHELVQRYYASNGQESFTGKDYMQETPNWAVYGSNERGFDPAEKRWKRKGKVEVNVDGGCG